MDRRIRERRRDVSRQRGRRRASLALLAALVLVAASCFLWLRSSDIFAVKRVSANPTVHVAAEQIEVVAAAALGKNLLALSTSELEKELLDLPYVRSVEVRRVFPNTLHVQVAEYEPVARVQVAEDTWLVAEDGRVLEKALPPRGAGLPLLVSEIPAEVQEGSQLPESIVSALAVAGRVGEEEGLAGWPAVKCLYVGADGSVAVVLADGSEVRLGEPKNLDQKLMVASKILKEYLRKGKRLQYVDVSAPERAAVSAVKVD